MISPETEISNFKQYVDVYKTLYRKDIKVFEISIPQYSIFFAPQFVKGKILPNILQLDGVRENVLFSYQKHSYTNQEAVYYAPYNDELYTLICYWKHIPTYYT